MNAKINLDVILLSFPFKEGISIYFILTLDLCIVESLVSIARVVFLMLLCCPHFLAILSERLLFYASAAVTQCMILNDINVIQSNGVIYILNLLCNVKLWVKKVSCFSSF
jgi:hypothetical protein